MSVGPAITGPVAGAQRVLVVEDSPTQALRLGQLLEASGFEVTIAPSAEDALAEINRALPDVLVTDFHLPGARGDELCRRIRMNVNTRGIPILMLTSDEAPTAEQRGLESGADDYVRKSAPAEILLIRIQALLRKSDVQAVLAPEDAAFATARILLVEDSPTYLQFLLAELGREGYQLETATSAAAALELLALRSFAGVVLDMNLPDMSGVELCRRFAGARRTVEQAYVLLVLSGEENTEEMNAVLASGADDVLGKSRDVGILKARLGALIRRKLLYEENQRIIAEFKERELALLQAEADRRAAEARAALAEQLAEANRELAAANRHLKDTQAQLVQSAKMASLGELVAGVAHEINNPLAFVMSYHGTVSGALQELVPQVEVALPAADRAKLGKLARRLADMRTGLERIQDLVVKLRTFSRLDEGESKRVDIEECIESVLTLLHHKLGDRIAVKRNFGGPRSIDCYPGPLNQVIMNVVANAIDAIEGDGVITITTAASGEMFVLDVADTGAGIPAAIRERIFEPFFTTKPQAHGTGLGLSISYGIVKKHGGDIEVRSEEGRGTVVSIKIPLGPGAAVDADVAARG